ncbi:spermidine synthase [Micrococcoides hystricis]|uniref:Spermidine synthase n=1 Tax=Micrococcoides hystricis TaxID=1572761 RepID=A0ABV6PAG9_9MICC
MARKRKGRSGSDTPTTVELVGTWEVDQGEARIEHDPIRTGGRLLILNGTLSSYLDPDPLVVEFEYMQWMAAALEAIYQDRQERLRLLHLGGAGCTLARWACARFPGAHNLVIENDAKLAALVREHVDLPPAPGIRIRVADAATELAKIHPGSRDVIIRDVFDDGETPPVFSTAEYARTAQEILAGTGVYLVNCGDRPNLRQARAEAATLTEVFRHVYAIADAAMFKGRRIGNIVYVCSDADELSAVDVGQLRRKLLLSAQDIQVWDTAQVRHFGGRTTTR